MSEYCTECGTEVKEEDKFCVNCGAKFAEPSTATREPAQNMSIPKQQNVQPQSYMPRRSPRRSNVKIIAAVAVAIIIVGAILFCTLQGSNNFVGTWRIVENYNNNAVGKTMTFHSDGTLSQSGSSPATWNIENNKLCIMSPEMGSTAMCFDYEFSNGGNRLTLSMVYGSSSMRVVLIRV